MNRVKIFFGILAFVGLLLQANADSIVSNDNSWATLCYGFGGWGITHLTTEYVYFGGDSLVASNLYKKVFMCDDSLHQNITYKGLIREQNEKTYFIPANDTTEFLLYDFSLEAGKYFGYNRFMVGWIDTFYVSSVDSVVINGSVKKRIQIKVHPSAVRILDTWIEGIGSLSGILYPCYRFGFGGGYIELLCFHKNNNLIYKNSSYSECYYDDSIVPISYSAIICQGAIYSDSNFVYLTQAGQYVSMFQDINGGDSTIWLRLFVDTGTITNYATSICEGNSYSDDNFTNLTQAGTYYDTLQNINGCDSIVCLTLNTFTISGTCGANLTWSLNQCDSTLTISGSGNMTDFDYLNPVPWHNNPYQNFITTVVIDDSVTSIGNGAFGYCFNLKSITIGNSVTRIGRAAFWACGLTSVIIPNSVTIIGDEAFRWCGLTSVTIGNNVDSIGINAFVVCNALTSVTIPSSVTSIGDGAFARCQSLTSINVDSNNMFYASDNGILFNKLKTTLVQYPAGKTDTTYVIPNSVITIGDGAFEACNSLTSVMISDSAIIIGTNAFIECYNLTSVTIGHGVIIIGYGAFEFCNSLTDITIPSNVVIIENWAFDCYSLTSVTMLAKTPPLLLGNDVFYSVDANIPVYIPCGTLSNYSNAAGWGDFFTNFIDTIMDTTVYRYFAVKCYNVPYTDDNFTNLTQEGVYYDTLQNVNGCDSIVCLTLNTFTISGTCGANLTWSLNQCDSTLTISGSGAMDNYLLASVDPIYYVYPPWHSSQNTIKMLIIGDSVTHIGNWAFDYCRNLDSVSIGNSVTTIGGWAFYYCESLTSVTIPNSVTIIERAAFYGCKGLDSLSIPNSVTTIEDNAFASCTGLTFITIPNSITSIEDYVFAGCTGLTSITIPESITNIGNWAFAWCSSLISVTIPNSVTSIEYLAFADCSSLTSVIIGNSVKNIGGAAFDGCTSINSITSQSITPPTLGYDVFFGVSNTISVYIPCGSKSAYQDSAGWNYFTNYIELMDTTFITDTVCFGTNYNNSGFNIPAISGIYYRTDSCSIICLTLTTYPNVPIRTYAADICEGANYQDDNFTDLTLAGIYYDTLQNINGCDSIIELTLIVNPAYFTQISDSISAGNSYDFHGKQLTASGIYYDTLQTIFGCDSIIELTLTVTGVGIVQLTIDNGQWRIYPNPTTDDFSLAYTLDNNSFVQIDLYSLSGSHIKNFLQLLQQEAGIYYYNFSLSGLPTGLYMLVFKTNFKTISNKIVKH